MSKILKAAYQLSLIILSCISLLSCYSGRKSQAAKTVSAAKEIIAAETRQIAAIDSAKGQKLAEENIDTTINNRIIAKLAKYNEELDSIKSKTALAEAKLLKGRSFRKYYKSNGEPDLLELDSFAQKASIRMARYNMIKDGIGQSKKRLFEMAAFFGPGIFNIPDDKIDLANERFIPVIDSLIAFANAYDSIEQIGTLVVNGYADGMNIDETSPLFNLLLTDLKKTSATKEELNHQLSQLRALAIANLMEKLVTQKKEQFTSWDKFSINLFEYGQGETYPTKTIKDYTTDDERRRVVLIYWSVLPKD